MANNIKQDTGSIKVPDAPIQGNDLFSADASIYAERAKSFARISASLGSLGRQVASVKSKRESLRYTLSERERIKKERNEREESAGESFRRGAFDAVSSNDVSIAVSGGIDIISGYLGDPQKFTPDMRARAQADIDAYLAPYNLTNEKDIIADQRTNRIYDHALSPVKNENPFASSVVKRRNLFRVAEKIRSTFNSPETKSAFAKAELVALEKQNTQKSEAGLEITRKAISNPPPPDLPYVNNTESYDLSARVHLSKEVTRQRTVWGDDLEGYRASIQNTNFRLTDEWSKGYRGRANEAMDQVHMTQLESGTPIAQRAEEMGDKMAEQFTQFVDSLEAQAVMYADDPVLAAKFAERSNNLIFRYKKGMISKLGMYALSYKRLIDSGIIPEETKAGPGGRDMRVVPASVAMTTFGEVVLRTKKLNETLRLVENSGKGNSEYRYDNTGRPTTGEEFTLYQMYKSLSQTFAYMMQAHRTEAEALDFNPSLKDF